MESSPRLRSPRVALSAPVHVLAICVEAERPDAAAGRCSPEVSGASVGGGRRSIGDVPARRTGSSRTRSKSHTTNCARCRRRNIAATSTASTRWRKRHLLRVPRSHAGQRPTRAEVTHVIQLRQRLPTICRSRDADDDVLSRGNTTVADRTIRGPSIRASLFWKSGSAKRMCYRPRDRFWNPG